MSRYCVAAKGVEHHDVEVLQLALVALALQRKPRVAEHDVRLSPALSGIGEVSEPLAAGTDFDHGRINIVKANRVAAIDVSCHRPCAQTDAADAYAAIAEHLTIEADAAADAAIARIVRRG